MVGQFRRGQGSGIGAFSTGRIQFLHRRVVPLASRRGTSVDIRPIDSHAPSPVRHEHRIRDRPSVGHLDGDGRALAVSSQIFGRLGPTVTLSISGWIQGRRSLLRGMDPTELMVPYTSRGEIGRAMRHVD